MLHSQPVLVLAPVTVSEGEHHPSMRTKHPGLSITLRVNPVSSMPWHSVFVNHVG